MGDSRVMKRAARWDTTSAPWAQEKPVRAKRSRRVAAAVAIFVLGLVGGGLATLWATMHLQPRIQAYSCTRTGDLVTARADVDPRGGRISVTIAGQERPHQLVGSSLTATATSGPAECLLSITTPTSTHTVTMHSN